MVQTTSHIFSGKVDIESNLLVGSSHLFVDTVNNRVGITTPDPDASLHVNGNAYVESNVGVGSNIVLDGDTGIITATEFRGDGSNLVGVLTSLENATQEGNTTSTTVQFTNADTSLVASGNVVVSGNVTASTFVGDGSQLTGIATNLQAITDNGNVTSNTVQFTNTGTSLTASGNIEVEGTVNICTGSGTAGLTEVQDSFFQTEVSSSLTLGEPRTVTTSQTIHQDTTFVSDDGSIIHAIADFVNGIVTIKTFLRNTNTQLYSLVCTTNTATGLFGAFSLNPITITGSGNGDTFMLFDASNVAVYKFFGSTFTSATLVASGGGSAISGIPHFSYQAYPSVFAVNATGDWVIRGGGGVGSAGQDRDMFNYNSSNGTWTKYNVGIGPETKAIAITEHQTNRFKVVSRFSAGGFNAYYGQADFIFRIEEYVFSNGSFTVTNEHQITLNNGTYEKEDIFSPVRITRDGNYVAYTSITTSPAETKIHVLQRGANGTWTALPVITQISQASSPELGLGSSCAFDIFLLNGTIHVVYGRQYANGSGGAGEIITLNYVSGAWSTLNTFTGSNNTGIGARVKVSNDGSVITDNAQPYKLSVYDLAASGKTCVKVALDPDMASNAARIGVLETDLTSNAARVSNLEAANAVQEVLINDLRTDVTSNTSRISSLETDRTSNTLRISLLESANIVQESLINDLRTDLTSNTARIVELEAANTVQETLINDLRTDVTSNAGRITDLETDLTSNTGRIVDLEAANTVQETLINDLRTDVTSNAARVAVLETDMTDNVSRIETLETANTVQASLISTLESANAVQAGLITNLTIDLSSNDGRITTLETANGVQATLITNLTTDLSSNDGRITVLEAANAVQQGLITELQTANGVQATLITNLTTDLSSNDGRITALETTIGGGTLTLQGITDLGNTTTNVIQFSNVTTGLVTTANVEVGGDVKISGLTTGKVPYVAADQFLKDSFITTTADATLIASNLDVTGNIFMRGERFTVESESKLINDAIIGIANNNTIASTDIGILMQRPSTNVALIHHGGTDKFTIGYTLDDLEATDITNDTANIINVNILGNLYVQNVVTATSFLGDGTALTGVALGTDLTSAVTRITDLEAANTVQEGLITDLQTSNTNIWSNLASNSYRIGTLETELAYPTFTTLTLDGIANKGNTTSNVLKLTNATTGLVADGNVHALKFHGDGSELTGIAATLQEITDNGNVTSNTIQFSNAITSLTAASNVVVTGNVTAGYFKGDGTGITGINLQQVASVGHTTTTPLITSNTLTGKRTGAFDSKGDSTTEGEVFMDNLNAGEMTSQSIDVVQDGTAGTISNPIVITYYVSNWLVNGQPWNDVFHFTFIEGLTYVFDISHSGIQPQTGPPHIGYFKITGDFNYGASSTPYELGVQMIGTQGTSGAQFRWTVPRGASSFQGAGGGSHPGPGYFWFFTERVTTGSVFPGQSTERRIRVIPNPDQHILTGQTQIHGDLYCDSTIVSTNVEATDLVSSTRALVSNVATMGTTKTFVVTVSGGVYYIDGVQQPSLELHENQTYIFDMSDSTNSGHPLAFSTAYNGATSSYTTGVVSNHSTVASGTAGSKVTWTVPAGAPSAFYYYCTVHGAGMGSSTASSISPTAELIVSGRVVVSGNVEADAFIGDGSQLTGISGATTSDLQVVTTNGATSTQAIQLTNTGTSLAASGAVTAASVSATGAVTAATFTGDGSSVNIGAMTAETVPYVDANKRLRDSHITRTADTTVITSNLQVDGNLFVTGETYAVNSENVVINDRIIGLANNNTSTTLDVGLILQYPQKNVAMIHHGTTSGSPHNGQLTLGYTQSDFEVDNITKDPSNNLTLNVWGHVVTQNNITVGSQGSYYGDGTTLTGVALSADLTNNVTRIEDLETATIISNSSTITTGFTKGDIIYASADNVLNKLAIGGTDGYVLKVTSAANKTLGWAAESGGGGGGSTVWQQNGNDIYYSSGDVGINTSAPAFDLDVHGTANVGALTATSLSVGGQTLALASDLSANATRLDAIYTGSIGDIIYVDAANSLAKLGIGSSGQVLKVSAGGLPIWANESGGGGGTSSQWTTVNTNEIYYDGPVGIANTDPGHDLSVGSNLYVDDDGSNVLVVTGNTAMSALTLGEVSIVPSYSLDQVVNTGNVTANTVQFSNAITSLTAASNVVVTGNVTAEYFVGDGSNLTGISSTLQAITDSGNVTSNTIQFSNAITGLVTTANVEVGGDLTVSGNTTVSSNLTVSGNVSDLNVVSNVNMLHTANIAAIKLNSNVVTEFPRSKKLIKYPRVNLTSASRNAYENGYKVTFSSEYNTTTWAADHVFDSDVTDSPGSWASAGSKYTSSGQTYSGGASIGGFSGEYVHLELPVSINLSLVRMLPRTYQLPCPQAPKNYSIIASTDGVTYDLLERVINEPDSGTFKEIHINTSKSYNRFAIVVEKTISADVAGISEIEYYGVPEYDPDAAGTDVVVKSDANVPNTDWLERYYDATNYSSGTTILDEVTATHRDATINGTVPLDTSDGIKSWSFTGNTSNFILGDDTIDGVPGTGDWTHSISIWFKTTNMADYQNIMMILPSVNLDGTTLATGSATAFFLRRKALADGDDSRRRLQILHWGQDVRVDYTFSENEWYNITYTYSGGGTTSATERVYVNGLYVPFIESTRTAATDGDKLNISSSSRVVLGKRYYSSSPYPFYGNIANFRIFKRALSSYEAWQLYAYQKEYFGHGDLSMTLKAGQLGIGTSKPRAALDVRGDVQVRGNIHGGCPIYFAAYNTNGTTAGNTVIWNELWISRGGGYDTGTGIFTAPLAGVYKFYYSLRQSGGSTSSLWARVQLNGADINSSYGAIYLSTTRDQGGSTVLLKLNAGDEISVKVYNYNMANGYSSFVGEYFSSL